VAIGLVAAALLSRLLARLLFDVAPLDPWTFAITSAVLLLVATVACYLPARRGTRMAPIDALRTN
jgi:ABC-type antimicrobial peptide transport system permease subunit